MKYQYEETISPRTSFQINTQECNISVLLRKICSKKRNSQAEKRNENIILKKSEDYDLK